MILPIGMQRMRHESYSLERNGKSIVVKFNCLYTCTEGKNNFFFLKKRAGQFLKNFYQGNEIAKEPILYELQPLQAAAIRTDTGTQQVSSLTQQQAILLRTD